MKLLKNILYAAVLMMTATTVAQQDPNYTLYRYNMNLVNPAYAGAANSDGQSIDSATELGLNLRSQWAGVEGAPETQSVFFGTPLGKNVGLGVSVIHDQTFIEKQTSVAVDVSYRVKLDEGIDLFFGVKVSGNSYDINTDGLTTFGFGTDPSLIDLDGSFTPNVGAGFYLKGKDYFVALSAPRLLSPNRLENINGTVGIGRNRIHSYLSLGYDIKISNDITFKPSTLLRYIKAAPLSLNITAGFEFYQRFEFGASYRLNEGFGGQAIVRAADWLDIGYAYEIASESPLSVRSQGTHEVYMKLRL